MFMTWSFIPAPNQLSCALAVRLGHIMLQVFQLAYASVLTEKLLCFPHCHCIQIMLTQSHDPVITIAVHHIFLS